MMECRSRTPNDLIHSSGCASQLQHRELRLSDLASGRLCNLLEIVSMCGLFCSCRACRADPQPKILWDPSAPLYD